MAFSGTITTTSLGARQVRISGAVLVASAAGTITPAGGGGDIELPASFPSLITDDIKITLHQTATGGAQMPFVVAKDSPFTTITVTNEDGVNDSTAMEIFVEAIHSVIK